MKTCFDCDILRKIECCCSCHPETMESVDLEIAGEILKVCPNLCKDGTCEIYSSRPEICRDFNECSFLHPSHK